MGWIKEYKCPITGQNITEYEEFSNVDGGKDYFYSISKIGDSIVYIQNRGDMVNYDTHFFYALLDRFIVTAGVKFPYAEIRSYKYLTGSLTSEAFQIQKDYLLKYQDRTAAFILSDTPLWIGIIAKAGFKRYNTDILFRSPKNYKESVLCALKILSKKILTQGKEDEFEHFKTSTIDGLTVRYGIINKNILLTIYSGVMDKRSFPKAMHKVRSYVLEKGLNLWNLYSIADISGLYNIKVRLLSPLRCTYFIVSSKSVKIKLYLNRVLRYKPIKFINSYNDIINGEYYTSSNRKNIKVSSRDIEEVNYTLGSLLWEDSEVLSPLKELDSSNPLDVLIGTLRIIREDLYKLRKKDKESLNDLTSILDSTEAGIVLINKESKKILYYNRVAGEIIGAQGDEIYSLNFEEYRSLFFYVRDECDREYSIINCFSGGTKPVYRWIKPINFQGKKYEIETFIEISEIIKSKNELQKALKVAENAVRSKSEFLANMSHEIRTPMNGILGALEIIKDSNLNEQQKFYIDIVKNSGESLLTIINQILDYSKLDAKKMELDMTPFDLKNLIYNLVSNLKILSGKKEISINEKIDDSIKGNYIGDPGRLKQVLFNLGGNAVKFTDSGSVTLLVEEKSIDSEKSCITFSIIDTGAGIPGESIQKLFDKFTQVDGSIGRKYGGTGLGLAISKEIVELMGGTIKVSSCLGEGSRFSFTIELEKVMESKAIENFIPTNLRILYLYDTFSQLIEDSLKDSANYYEKGIIDNFESNGDWDLVVIDINLPSVESLNLSYTVLKRFKTDKALFITSSGSSGDAIKIKNSGYNGYITAPYTKDLISKSIKSIFESDSFITKYYIQELGFESDKILLVDDNKTNRLVAKKLLEKLNYLVDEAVNGREAIDKVKTTSYQLVFMDMQMPVLDGLKATSVIREFSDIPIIAMTANVTLSDKKSCFNAGMNDFIPKPIRPDKLKEIIRRYL